LRWLYHLAPRGTKPVAGAEGFIHASFATDVEETRRLYYATEGRDLWRIDPRRLDARVELAATPRGPMPHIHGAVPDDACHLVDTVVDEISEHRVAFVAFQGMTLLDLVGVLDPVSRLKSARCEVIAADASAVWEGAGARFDAARVRPSLDDVDVLVVAGGLGTRSLRRDRAVTDWLRTYPTNRLAASVCTGALLLGAAGRLDGKRATTHRSAFDLLPEYGATPVSERVVDEGQLVTAGGVTSAIDLGLHLVRRLAGDDDARTIAAQMEHDRSF
jgi:cyclohexyl-isocyanide hydratase